MLVMSWKPAYKASSKKCLKEQFTWEIEKCSELSIKQQYLKQYLLFLTHRNDQWHHMAPGYPGSFPITLHSPNCPKYTSVSWSYLSIFIPKKPQWLLGTEEAYSQNILITQEGELINFIHMHMLVTNKSGMFCHSQSTYYLLEVILLE